MWVITELISGGHHTVLLISLDNCITMSGGLAGRFKFSHYLPNFLCSISYPNNLLSDMFLHQIVNTRKYHTEPSVKRYPLEWTDDLTLG